MTGKEDKGSLRPEGRPSREGLPKAGALERTEPGESEGVPMKVAVRDLMIFQLKLALDGLGDLVLAPISLLAFVIDLLPGRTAGKLFYAVLRFGERWDRWLSLYRPSTEAGKSRDGLLEAGRVDADTFLGKVEEVVRTSAKKASERDRS